MSYHYDHERGDVQPTPDHKPTEGERAAERRARIETLLSAARRCRARANFEDEASRIGGFSEVELACNGLARLFEDLAARLREGIDIEL